MTDERPPLKYPDAHPKADEIRALKSDCSLGYDVAVGSREAAREAYKASRDAHDDRERAEHLRTMGEHIDTCLNALKKTAEDLVHLQTIVESPWI